MFIVISMTFYLFFYITTFFVRQMIGNNIDHFTAKRAKWYLEAKKNIFIYSGIGDIGASNRPTRISVWSFYNEQFNFFI